FPSKWIGSISGLNPLEYYLWGHLKSFVYKASVDTVETLRQRVDQSCRQIRVTSSQFERVQQFMMGRIHTCIKAVDGHFEKFF
ncbi:hypothetical protein WH47_02290, partial [Habropoda laboriosa]